MVLLDLRSRVTGALDQLPKGQREATLLHYIEGLPQAEVAELLGTRPSAIKTRLQRARQQLRNLLIDEREAQMKTDIEWVPMRGN